MDGACEQVARLSRLCTYQMWLLFVHCLQFSGLDSLCLRVSAVATVLVVYWLDQLCLNSSKLSPSYSIAVCHC